MSGTDDDENALAPPPLAPPPAGTVEGTLGPLDAQRLQPPAADAQRLQPPSAEAQRLQADNPAPSDAQRLQDAVPDAQRTNPLERANDTQRLGQGGGRLKSLRHARPRMLFAAAVVVAGGGTALIVNAQRDDPSTVESPPSVSAAPSATEVPATTRPPSTAAPATTEPATTEPDTTAAATTVAPTTVAPTTVPPTTVAPTTVAPAVTLSGIYDVTVTDVVVSGPGVEPIPIPDQAPEQWQLSGPCDGVGECVMAPTGTALGAGGPGVVESVTLVPSGAGRYVGMYEFDAPGCGPVTYSFDITYGDGQFSGAYLAEGHGNAECFFTVTAAVAGTRVG